MNSTEPSTQVARPLITGPIIVGVTLNWYLYGILTMQYYIYLTHEKRDKKFLQWTVHFIFLLDTAQSVMALNDVFFWFVYNFGNSAKLSEFSAAGITTAFLDSVIAFIVQLVYCWRVWVLGKWRVIPGISAILAVIAAVNGCAVGAHDLVAKEARNIKPVWRIPDYLWLLSSAGADLILAGSMAYLLLKFQRSTYTSRNTVQIIKRVLLFSFETNMVTALLATIIVLFFPIKAIAPPKTNIYLTGGYILGKVYSNCFMVLLNQRLSADARGRNATNEFGSHSGARAYQISGTTAGVRGHETQNQVEVEVSVIQFRDPKSDRHRQSLEAMEMGSWSKDRAGDFA